MDKRLKIGSLLLIVLGFCLNNAEAGFLDSISSKAKSLGDKATQTLGDVKGKASKITQDSTKAFEGLKTQAAAKINQAKDTAASTVAAAKNKSEELKSAAAATVDTVKTKGIELKDTATGMVGNLKSKEADSDFDQGSDEAPQASEPAPTADAIADSGVNLVRKNDTDALEGASEYPAESIAKIDSFFPEKEMIEKNGIVNANGLSINDLDVPYLIHRVALLADEGVEKITLNLANNHITVEGLAMLLEGLKTYPKLISILNLSGNNLGDDGAILFAEYLKNFPMLNFTVLSNTGIGGDGGLVLISEIAKGKSEIQMLDLSNNKITEDHLDLIIEQLKSKDGLLPDGLVLSGNPLNLPENVTLPSNVIVD